MLSGTHGDAAYLSFSARCPLKATRCGALRLLVVQLHCTMHMRTCSMCVASDYHGVGVLVERLSRSHC